MPSTRKHAVIAAVAAGAVALAAALIGYPAAGAAPADPKAIAAGRLARGKYLVSAAGCNDCHTPLKMGPKGPEPDMSRMLSGHPHDMKLPPPPKLPEGPWNWVGASSGTAFAGPWGVSYASNLTPDETGIGVWTEPMFIEAIRNGRHYGGSRPLLPPMPWSWIATMSDEDLKSIFAYLMSVPKIRNDVPPPVIAPH